jgi:hypothetical protein
MIPEFNVRGELPSGVHPATIQEIEKHFGSGNAHRERLFRLLLSALDNLKNAAVKRVYINGSFITDKGYPNDVDGCWDVHNEIDQDILDPVFLDFSRNRQRMKEKYGVDFFIAGSVELGSGYPFVQFFQTNKEGHEKGIILLNL